ncbi:MAG: helix-turn-helix domain-containing protein [Clostridia bacterium]|nr:helix-turn-helix domain-containing protein [Clostridia bacterium]
MNIDSKPLFSKEIDRINMTFSTVSFAEVDSSWGFTSVNAPYTRIYLITDGEGFVTCGNVTTRLEAGNVYFIPGGNEFTCECPDRMSKIYFHVNVLRYNNYDILNGYNKCITLKGKEKEIAEIGRLLKVNSINAVLQVKSQVLAMLCEAIEQENIELGEIEEYSKSVKRAIALIDKHLSANLRIPYIAEKLYISGSRLQKDFRREVGVPIGKYINDRLMFRAQAMLCDPSASIKDVSDALGFCDQFYFSRKFSQYFNTSPLTYKKKIK